MRVLIVGASGQLGGHLRARLVEQGHAVAGTYAGCLQPGLVRLDLDDAVALAAAVRDVTPDLVILAAGWTWVDGNERDPARSTRQNRDRPLDLARSAARRGALFVTYSTDYVFDGARGPYPEEAAPGPLNAYGRAKLELEEALAREGIEHLVLRTTTVYGPEAQGKNFVYQLVGRLLRGEQARVPLDQVATPSYGPDVADATLALIERGARGIWHVAGPDVLDRGAFARLACNEWGLDADAIEYRATAELGQPALRPLRGGLLCPRLAAAGIPMRGAREGLAAMRAALAAGGYAPLG